MRPRALEGWGKVSLGEITVERGERVGRREDSPIVLSCTKHFGLVPSDSYFKGRTIYSSDLSNYKLVQRGWFAYATNHLAEGSIGLQTDFAESCVSPIYTVFSTAPGVSPFFLRRVLKYWRTVEQYKVHEQASVNRRGAVRYRDFSKIEIRLPPEVEQRHIAEILDTVDDAIRRTEQIIAKLEQVKQGLLHDLLTLGIDDNGELRDPVRHPEQFKDSPLGRIPKNWAPAVFSDCLVGTPKNGIYKPSSAYAASGTAIVRIDSFYGGDLAPIASLKKVQLTSTEERDFRLMPGDILVNRVNSIDYVGKAAVVGKLSESLVFESNIMRCRLNFEFVSPGFIIRWLTAPWSRRWFFRRAKSAIAQASVNQSDVLDLPVAVPPIAEQQRIEVRWNDVVEAQVAEGRELAKLQLLKKGLMDDLLTGRVRVTPLLDEDGEATA